MWQQGISDCHSLCIRNGKKEIYRNEGKGKKTEGATLVIPFP